MPSVLGGLSTSGRLAEAAEMLAYAEDVLIRDHGATGLRPWIVFQEGVHALMCGRVRTAQRILDESCKETGFVPLAAPHLVEAYALTGDSARAEAASNRTSRPRTPLLAMSNGRTKSP